MKINIVDQLMPTVLRHEDKELCLSIAQKMQRDIDQWVSELRSKGVKAAHGDDGCIDRDKKEIFFGYPYFNDNPKPGDLIAIGDPRYGQRSARHRLVIITWGPTVYPNLHSRYNTYGFEEIEI